MKKILIIGLGKTGISCIKYFILKKYYIYLIDNNLNYNKNILKKFLNYNNIKLYIGFNKISWILQSKLIILSPGISLNFVELDMIKLYNIKIISDIEIFLNKKKNKKIIAITGSNGKSTVLNIVYNIIKKSNLNVSIGGNIGIPVLDIINEESDIYILELSSFQLEIINNSSFYISIILNITNNHIDKHINFENYKLNKLKIFNNSENCIFNNNDSNTFPKNRNINSKYITFGSFNSNYSLFYDKNNFYLYKRNIKFINCNKLKIKSKHFYLNVLASLAITDLIQNVTSKNQIDIIKNFSTLKHRLETFYFKNIRFINDSKSTNSYSTISAINSISKFNYIHLILGGYDKLNDFTILSNFIKYKNIVLYIYGVDKYKISKYFNNLLCIKNNLKSLIKIIKYNLYKNDVILFSPSCSSKDQYKSFENRGNKFIKYINEIIIKK
ncbi:UDP-N-acetylmuramoylalanine--D-glutamate ligase [endosymbiont of Euscepes postfasciatus]|uniref:UDP-N-acetylmuramoyl-L-alanine--D-glutamate ligase n=1 Tax=endosymbiont of Euscepes postfasciatus TaxID=650377 RepID=UPI000DC7323C|nr:UDP-N-acetylmuramoyl-L-alanine--D-glutamate ligase [endosymbiont of Euscepes postfasciatus]BBA84555.1 UDP-N-acetylmuramoylalanine--D-glutamate ligase [endosymbiont of Euscepes postfasciatus]